MTGDTSKIDKFFAGAPHAVVSASEDRSKYGNRALRAYLQNNRQVYPVTLDTKEVESSFPGS